MIKRIVLGVSLLGIIFVGLMCGFGASSGDNLEVRTHQIAKEVAIAVVDSALNGTTPPPIDPPPIDPPPDTGACDDPFDLIDPQHAKCVTSGFWEGFATGQPSKLRDDGSNREKNATIKALDSILGTGNNTQLNEGAIKFSVMVNAEGLVNEGGGKHLVNLASKPLSRGSRGDREQTRLEIAQPGRRAKVILHNYDSEGRGGSQDLGYLPFQWVPNVWLHLEFRWLKEGDNLKFWVNGNLFEATLLPGAEGPGRYWGPGHFETNDRGGVFWYTLPEKL